MAVVSRGLRHHTRRTSYGVRVIRSNLALAALATAAVPGMRPVQVAGIRTGEESPLHQSALVEDVTGRTWLVRAPLGAAAGAELERNDDLIRQLGKHLPFKVPAAAGYADLGQDGRAAVYPYVEGQGLSLRHLPAGPGLSSAVGRALAAIHNMPRELFEEHAVPVFDAAEFRSRKLTELDRAAETGHVPNGLLARWEQALDADVMWEFATVPTHGSLDGSSFLVVFSEDDAASGRVVGITGWERAQVADPGEDFARLVQQAHPHAVDAVFESYSMARGQRPDGYLLNRARLASEMRLLGGLVAALGADDQAFVRTRADQLRKLDRLTANDNSLVPRTAAAASGESPTDGTADETAPEPAPDPAGQGDGSATVGSAAQSGTLPESDAEEFQPANGTATDVTRPVPVPVDDDDDEPAFVVEEPTDGGQLEPVRAATPETAPQGPDTEQVDGDSSEGPQDTSPTDVTAPIPLIRATPAEQTGQVSPPTAATDLPEAEDSGDDTPGDTNQANNTDETGDTNQAGDTDQTGDADQEDSTEHDPTPEAGQAGAAESVEDTASSDEQDAEDLEQERLHTLYGMPDEDELGPDQR